MDLEVSITGTPSGDGECFCFEVTEEEYRRICGEESYNIEKECRKNSLYCHDPNVWFVYPGDLFGYHNKIHVECKITIL